MREDRSDKNPISEEYRAAYDDEHREVAIRALPHEMRVVMAKWALKGYRFVYFSLNGTDRQWKALDYSRNAGRREVHTARTLYVLLSALGEPK